MTGKYRRSVIAVAAVVMAVAAATLHTLVIYPQTPGPGNGELREIEVPMGVGPKKLGKILQTAGIISNSYRFAIWLRATSQLTEVKAGRFRVSDRATPRKIIRELSGRGLERGIRVTIPEGTTLRQMGSILERAGLCTQKAFIEATTNAKGIRKLGIPGQSAEGFLFPDTYFFHGDRQGKTDPQHIIQKMHANFKRQTEFLGHDTKVSIERLVTLASIVQSEASAADEMPLIAGVYENRLTKTGFSPRLMQADPTVSYGCEPHIEPRPKSCEHFRGVLTHAQLVDVTNKYNTYKHPGLPPGPISAPGLDALKAAQKPAHVPYFYFVVKEEGRHAFSTTLEEHNEAVKRFRQKKKASGE
jgi:UPF0755 protein